MHRLYEIYGINMTMNINSCWQLAGTVGKPAKAGRETPYRETQIKRAWGAGLLAHTCKSSCVIYGICCSFVLPLELPLHSCLLHKQRPSQIVGHTVRMLDVWQTMPMELHPWPLCRRDVGAENGRAGVPKAFRLFKPPLSNGLQAKATTQAAFVGSSQ